MYNKSSHKSQSHNSFAKFHKILLSHFQYVIITERNGERETTQLPAGVIVAN